MPLSKEIDASIAGERKSEREGRIASRVRVRVETSGERRQIRGRRHRRLYGGEQSEEQFLHAEFCNLRAVFGLIDSLSLSPRNDIEKFPLIFVGEVCFIDVSDREGDDGENQHPLSFD